MKVPAPKPVQGRRLGWSEHELATLPYARFWNPVMADISADAHRAVANSPMAEALFPAMAEAIGNIPDAEVQNGFTITSNGAMHLNLVTEMPAVTPAMIDWWFGWHSDSPERYKLWHPKAHVHAQWATPPPAGSTGRTRYVGYTSEVDEYLGSAMIRGATTSRPSPAAASCAHASGWAAPTSLRARLRYEPRCRCTWPPSCPRSTNSSPDPASGPRRAGDRSRRPGGPGR